MTACRGACSARAIETWFDILSGAGCREKAVHLSTRSRFRKRKRQEKNDPTKGVKTRQNLEPATCMWEHALGAAGCVQQTWRRPCLITANKEQGSRKKARHVHSQEVDCGWESHSNSRNSQIKFEPPKLDLSIRSRKRFISRDKNQEEES